jgi:hypothetical protein
VTGVVNLRQARKTRARDAAKAAAAENAARHGRSKGDKKRVAAETALAEARLDGHRREGSEGDGDGA